MNRKQKITKAKDKTKGTISAETSKHNTKKKKGIIEAKKSREDISKKEYKYFEELLLEERKKVINNLLNLDPSALAEQNTGTGTGEDISDYAETGTDAFDIQVALSLASGESEQLQEIDEALERIKNGTYGICEMCKKPIPRKRLEVIPFARYCVQCQSEFEKEQESPYA